MRAATYIFLVGLLLVSSCKSKYRKEDKIHKALLLTKTEGYRHESIDAGVSMFEEHAKEWQLNITQTEETISFTPAALSVYDVIILLNTTGDLFNVSQQAALQYYIQNGGAVLGIHAATDAEYDWEWYGQMIGAWFADHPHIQEASCIVNVTNHPATIFLPEKWSRTDEWYNFRALRDDSQFLVSVDESTYAGGKHGNAHPVSWSREFDGGRIFYTAMGHTAETYSEPLFIEHIKGALDWLTAE